MTQLDLFITNRVGMFLLLIIISSLRGFVPSVSGFFSVSHSHPQNMNEKTPNSVLAAHKVVATRADRVF